MSELLTFEQAGERIRCGPETIRRLVLQGELAEVEAPASGKLRGPRLRKVRKADLDAAVKKWGSEVAIVPLANPDRSPIPSRKVATEGFSKP